MPALQIVIVNWNSGEQLCTCLTSIAKARTDDCELVRVGVVDNASTDGSADNLGDLPFPLVLIRNKENQGFAAACNQGAKGSQADYLLFLNPDTVLQDDSLDAPVRFLDTHPRYGICGIQLIYPAGNITRSCARFPTLCNMMVNSLGLDRILPGNFKGYHMDDWPHSESREVDHVIGAFYLVRRSLFEQLGGFDERFFVYLEDLDFSLRAKVAGSCSYYLAEVKAYHREHGSSEKVKARRLFYALRSRILYAYKHFALPSATVVLLETVFLEPVIRVVHGVVRLSVDTVIETFSAYFEFLHELPRILRIAFRRR